MKTVNNQTVLNVVESMELEGFFCVEADGVQVSVLTSEQDANEMADAMKAIEASTRHMKTYTYNPSLDLQQRVAHFGQVVVKGQVTVFAYLVNGEYSDIFQYSARDYRIDIADMNQCAKTAMAGVMYCMTAHNSWLSTPLRKQA